MASRTQHDGRRRRLLRPPRERRVDPTSAIGAGDPLGPGSFPSSGRDARGSTSASSRSPADPASVELVVLDGGGSVKGRLAIDLDPFGSRQVTDVHGARPSRPPRGTCSRSGSLSGEGRVVAWATAVDNGSNDGLLVTASRPSRGTSTFPPRPTRRADSARSSGPTSKLSNPWPCAGQRAGLLLPVEGRRRPKLVLSLGSVGDARLRGRPREPPGPRGGLRRCAPPPRPREPRPASSPRAGPTRRRRRESYGLAIDVLDNAEAVPGERIALTFLSSSPETRTNLGFLETAGLDTSSR